MTFSIQDLQERAQIESNTLKSVILTSSKREQSENFSYSLDDVLIHDYQNAGAITLNSILFNYTVDLNYAIECILNSSNGNKQVDSYFKIVDAVDEYTNILDEDTKLLLDMDANTFKTRSLVYDIQKLEPPKNIKKFIQFDSVWYGIQDCGEYDQIVLLEQMNKYYDKFIRENPFDYINSELLKGYKVKINDITENEFFNNSSLAEDSRWDFGEKLIQCKYIISSKCVYDGEEFKYSGFIGIDKTLKEITDLGSSVKTFGKTDVEYLLCDFKVLSKTDDLNMFLAVNDNGKQKYFYLNEDTIDEYGGIRQITALCSDGLIVSPDSVFSRLGQLSELGDDVTIAMTDYGFWDIEENTTNDVIQMNSRGREYSDECSFNSDTTKLISPITKIEENSRYFEYEKFWNPIKEADRGYWWVNEEGTVKFPDYIHDSSSTYIGSNENLAIYSNKQILAKIKQDQFKSLLYGDSVLSDIFTNYIFNNVVKSVESYLSYNYTSILDQVKPEYDFDGIRYADSYGSILNRKFTSIQDFIENVDSTLVDETKYLYDQLNDLKFDSKNDKIEWIFNSVDSTKSAFKDYFRQAGYMKNRQGYIESNLGKMLKKYPLLAYFRDYLKERLENHFSSSSILNTTIEDIDSTSIENSINAIQGLIKNKVPASLILGGYQKPTEEYKWENDCYPNLTAYIGRNIMSLNKSDIQGNAYSLQNSINEMKNAVLTSPFFSQNTWQELFDIKSDESLFHIEDSSYSEYVNQTGYLDSSTDTLNIDWDSTKSQLFDVYRDDETVLKSLVKQQIYRNVYFNPTDYRYFTRDYDKYHCETKKYFMNQYGDEKELVFESGNWGMVDKSRSSLGDVEGQFKIDNIRYFQKTNRLRYVIKYEPITLFTNDTFLYDDVEYYVIYDGEIAKSVYFNLFNQDNLFSNNQYSEITDGNKFELNGSEYIIRDNSVYLVLGNYEGYVCGIKDGRFVIDGLYCCEVDSENKIKYAKIQDNELKMFYLTESEYGEYNGVSFQFGKNSDNEKIVKITKRHQSEITDRLLDEWCEYDNENVEFNDSRTYEWYLANLIVRFREQYNEDLSEYGNGVLYEGNLDKPDVHYIDIKHDVYSGDVISRVFLTIGNNGEDGEEEGNLREVDYGAIYNSNAPILDANDNLVLSEVEGKTVSGAMENGLIKSGIFDPGVKFILKDPSSPQRNNINSLWVDMTTYNSLISYNRNIGTIADEVYEEDSSSGSLITSYEYNGINGDETLEVKFHYDENPNLDLPFDFSLAPRINEQGYIYAYTSSDTDIQFNVVYNRSGQGFIHFMAQGRDEGIWRRYILNLENGQIDQIQFNRIENVNVVDFTTENTAEKLRDELTRNVIQSSLNKIVQTMMMEESDGEKPLYLFDNIYLDMFQDQISLQNYLIYNKDTDSDGQDKFLQVFKNHLNQIEVTDESFIFGKFLDTINGVFFDNQTLELVNSPTIKVKRVFEDKNPKNDDFWYDVVFDIYINQNNNYLKNIVDDDYDTAGYVLTNAIIKDLHLWIKIVPEIKNGKIGYTRTYWVKPGNYAVEYGKIAYAYNGYVRTKILSPKRTDIISIDNEKDKIHGETYDSTLSSLVKNSNITQIIENTILREDVITAILVKINNKVADDINRKEVVEYEDKINLFEQDSEIEEERGIWDIYETEEDVIKKIEGITDSGTSKLIDYNYGMTYIMGARYDVDYYLDDEDKLLLPYLKQYGGVQKYYIKNGVPNRSNQRSVIGIADSSSSALAAKYISGIEESESKITGISKTSDIEEAIHYTYSEAINEISTLKKAGYENCYLQTDSVEIEEFDSDKTYYVGDYVINEENDVIHYYICKEQCTPNAAQNSTIPPSKFFREVKLDSYFAVDWNILHDGENIEITSDYMNSTYSMLADKYTDIKYLVLKNNGEVFKEQKAEEFNLVDSTLSNLDIYIQDIKNKDGVEYPYNGNEKYVLVNTISQRTYGEVGPGLLSDNKFSFQLKETELVDSTEMEFEIKGYIDQEEDEADSSTDSFDSDIYDYDEDDDSDDSDDEDEDEDYTNDDVGEYWFGKIGKVTVKFTGLKGEKPKAEVKSFIPCYEFSNQLPDTRRGIVSSEISRIFGEGGKEIEVEKEAYYPSSDESSYLSSFGDNSENDGEQAYATYEFRFKVPIIRESCILALPLEKNYAIPYYFITVDSSKSDFAQKYIAQPSLRITEYKKNSEEKFGTVAVPTNLDETIHNINGVESKKLTTFSNLELSNYAYFEYEYDEDNPFKFTTEPREVPTTVSVVHPSQTQISEYGDIINRKYDIQQQVIQGCLKIDQSEEIHIDDEDIWIDKLNVINSIKADIEYQEYKKLLQSWIPQKMRDKVNDIVRNDVKLDDGYFDYNLTKLQEFLQNVDSELFDSNTLKKDEVLSELANQIMSYDVHAEFRNFAPTFNVKDSIFIKTDKGYTVSENNLLVHIKDEFYGDFNQVNISIDDDIYHKRDYYNLINDGYKYLNSTKSLIDSTITSLYGYLNVPKKNGDEIYKIFGKDNEDSVRYINAINTNIKKNEKEEITSLFFSNGYCHVFTKIEEGGGNINILKYMFPSDSGTVDNIVTQKVGSDKDSFTYNLTRFYTRYPITDENWLFKCLNRDFNEKSPFIIDDSYAIHCKNDDYDDLWLIPPCLDSSCICSPDKIKDMAYEQIQNVLYVIYEGDPYIYAYFDIQNKKNSKDIAIITKQNFDLKISTFNSTLMTYDSVGNDRIYIDYDNIDDDGHYEWKLSLYGHVGQNNNVESWSNSPQTSDYQTYNTIMFGDSIFNSNQIRFQNASKNKEMYDILDISDVDGCYYGLFKKDNEHYTVFKCPQNGVISRLPWDVAYPIFCKTLDTLYSLYVVSRENDKLVLREISVPDAKEYIYRKIDIQDIYEKNGETSKYGKFEIGNLIMGDFKVGATDSRFFALTNLGFHSIYNKNEYQNYAIESLEDFQKRIKLALEESILAKHLSEMHENDDYFSIIKSKINQYGENFSIFGIIPIEFDRTQDVGVIPSSKIDDTDQDTDHRHDSVLTATDIIYGAGMVAQSDSNPGIIVGAISNPATTYDDNTVFAKSQRNPLIQGTEFYDYIYDNNNGTVLADLYQLSFIYRINTNNTYDLYINVPTTRTKYLNRVAGTLKDDGTSIVQKNENRTRINFGDEMMANNLDESTTRLRIYIDRKYISIGNVELVEISGNSIPQQIYRDVPNNYLYDSIALDSRWTGETEYIGDQEQDMNKVMLEFECYGTDSQSIHIKGKTLIHYSLDDNKYDFS